jgi:hypothetical protein
MTKRDKKTFLELPKIYDDLRDFALTGFLKMIVMTIVQIEALDRMSFENMLALESGLERQSVINSIATKIIPLKTAFGEIVKEMVDSRIIKIGTNNESQGNKV